MVFPRKFFTVDAISRGTDGGENTEAEAGHGNETQPFGKEVYRKCHPQQSQDQCRGDLPGQPFFIEEDRSHGNEGGIHIEQDHGDGNIHKIDAEDVSNISLKGINVDMCRSYHMFLESICSLKRYLEKSYPQCFYT